MKKILVKTTIFTFSLFLFIMSSLEVFAQQINDNGYAIKKVQFWNQYLIYKSNLDNNIVAMKPVDPSGLFYIDDNNNFAAVTKPFDGGIVPAYNAPWINNSRNVVAPWVWSQDTTAYVSIDGLSGTVQISPGVTIDDQSFGPYPIGFSFTFDSVAYSNFGVQANGWISMGSTLPASSYTPISTGTTNNVIAALAKDLYGLPGNSAKLMYQLSGSSPNRVLTVEWKNWGNFSTGLAEYNFQIKLYETSNLVRIHYGSFSGATTSSVSTQVGLTGAARTDFNNRNVPLAGNWSSSTKGTTNADICYVNPPALIPTNGLRWTWTQPAGTNNMAYTSSNTAQLLVGLPVAPNTINNQIIQVQVVTTGAASPFNVTGLNLGTDGSNNASVDIASAKVFYSGTYATFDTNYAILYGTYSSPNGTFVVNGNAGLATGTNYFWITYNITGGAVTGDSVDAQCNSLTGSGTMGTVIPTTIAPAGSRPVDPYCLGTVTNSGCPYAINISNVTFGSINNSTGCTGNMPYMYNNYTNLTTTVRQNNSYGMTVAIPSYSNSTAFGIWVDWNNNNSFADGGEFYPTSVINSALTNPATANILVPAGATLGNHRMRVRANFSVAPTSAQYCANLTYGEQEDYTINVIADTNMTYSSSTATQTVTSAVYSPSLNTQIIGIEINTFGTISPINATSFSLNTNGSTNPSTDISTAKLWYTGTNPNFAMTTQFGGAYNNPNGAFVINGSQQLAQGNNYFWLTYNIPLTATAGDTLDAECSSITVAGSGRIPTVQAPAGNRIIGGTKMAGTYTIPGNYPNFTSAINDLNARGISSAVTFNVAAGFVDTAANLTITASGTAAYPIIFQKVGTDNPLANPVIMAGIGTSTTTDGIIKISGGDYITFDGIDLQENPANTTTTTQMEWGYALVKNSGTDGCQNVTIKNCSITLNKTNPASVGIYGGNHSAASTITFTVTSAAGANSNNTFFNNTITNAYTGVSINGYADGVPYSFYDQNNTIDQNNISNYGGTATTAYGVYNIYQNGLTISNCTINSSGGINSTGTLYGIFCSTMNNSNLTISNNTVTIVSASLTSSIYGINFGNGSAGTTNNINILNNTVQNSSYLTATSGAFYHIYCNATTNNLTVSGNRVIGNTHGTAGVTTGIAYYIYSLNAALSSITITDNLDSGNSVNGTTAYSAYRIYNAGATNSLTITGNRVKNNTLGGTTATATCYGIYNTTGTYSCNISNNTVSSNSMVSTSSQSMYFMYNTSTAPSMNYSSNTVTANTSTGTGSLYSLFYSASPPLGSTVNITNNTVTNQQKLTATGTGTIYGIYQGGSSPGTVNINDNTVTGFSSAAATTFYGIYQAGSPPNNLYVNNNKVGNLTNAGAAAIYGIYCSATTTTMATLTQDSIFNLTSAGSTIYGMYISSGATWNIYKNNISGISAGTSTTALAYGLYSAVAVASTVNIYNNFISDIKTPASTSIAPALSGIYIASGLATTNLNIYYNTVYLNSTSTSATTFGTAGIYALTTPVVDMRNNVIVNTSAPGPTGGQTVAYRRSSNILTTYAGTSNNNCFYAGAPSATRLIFYDGTNSDQTLAAYQTRVNPRDNVSATENPPFVNSTTPPYDLRILTGTGTQLESGGRTISAPISIIADAFNTPRYPNPGYPVGGFTPVAPDIGAHEFGGLNADLVPPSISYTPLGNGPAASSRAFINVVITDASGLNTTSGTRPRCYYKKSTDSNTVNDTTNLTSGWKYVQAAGTTSPFDFTIDYSKLYGGTGVVAGDTIQYFVIAQDLASTPNVGYLQATFTAAPTSVALTSANVPITSTLSYIIVSNSFSGSYNVGSSQTYTSLTGAGGLFAAINSGIVSGNLTINITSDLTEDGTNGLNLTNEAAPGGYTITFVPADTAMKTISGNVANGMIRLNGVRRVTFDGAGSFGGKHLTFRNTNGTNPTFTFINDAVRDTIKNCYVESNNTNTASGTIVFSTTTGLQGNDSNAILNCDIRDRSDAAGTPANGIYSLGTTSTLVQYNNYNVVSGCNIYNFFYDLATTYAGIYLTSGSSDWTINGNSFYQTVPRTLINGPTFCGIYNASTLNNNINITGNYIGGSAPTCGGSAMTYSGAGTYTFYGIYLSVGGLVQSSVQGNTIQNISLTTSPASGSSTFFRGIYVPSSTSYVNIGNLSGNTIGSGTGTGSITFTTNTTASSYTLICIQHVGFGSIMNNTIGSITFGGNSTSTANSLQGIQWSNTTAGQTYTVSNNLIGSLSTPNSIQQTNTVTGNSLRGIVMSNGAGTINNVNNNIIANWTDYSTSALYTTSLYGIQNSGAGNYNMSGNTVFNLAINTNVLTASFMLLGVNSTASGFNNFTQNTVFSLYSNGTGAGSVLAGGILAGGTSGGTVSRNKVYDFKFAGTGTLAPGPLLLGLNVQSTGPYTLSNNLVSLTNGDTTALNMGTSPKIEFKQVVVENPPVNLSVIPTETIEKAPDLKLNEKLALESIRNVGLYDGENPNPRSNREIGTGNEPKSSSSVSCFIAGVYHTSTSLGPCNYYYNTFYIGGTQPGGYNSWTFIRTSTGAVGFRNNLFINARNGGTGSYFVFANEGSVPASGWTSASSNYNVLLGSNASTIGEWGIGTPQTFAQWVQSSGGDNQTWSTTTGTINPSNLLTNIGTGNLSIRTGNPEAWLVSGKGIALTGQNIDYTGDSRVTSISGGCTDIGADEFTATPPSNPVAVQTGTPGSGTLTTYTLWGRTLCSIEWGSGGTSYPASMNVNYYTGLNPLNTATLGSKYSNSYWTVTPASGSFSGTTYDITFNFGDNETYTISTPNTNTILGKYNNFWESFISGTGSLKSELNWPGLSVKTRGLSNFSSFALTDNSLAVELLSPSNNATYQPASLTLVWSKAAAATLYRVQLATDSLFTSLVVNDSTVTDTTRLVSGLTLNIPYFWRVQPKNVTSTGPYSMYFKFTTGTPPSAPPPPVLSSPTNGTTGLPLSLNLVWLTAPTAATYRLQVATDSLFTSLIVNDSTLTDTTRAVSGLTPLTVYYWRVNAKNTVGTSAYSAVWNFKTVGSPLQVTLVNPPNNTVNTPVSVTCLWNKAGEQTALSINEVMEKGKDNNDLILNYWFELTSDTVSFANLQRDTTLTDTLKFVAGLQNATKYFWRVKAKNETGWGTFSGWWNFTTIIAAPILVSPLNNSTGNPPSPTLIWRLTQTATSYRVQVATDSLFGTLIVNDSTVTDTTKAISGLSPLTFYWWRVNAKNVNGTGAFSPVWKFKTMGSPTQVVLVSPANGATNQPLSITFVWRKSNDQTLDNNSKLGKNTGQRNDFDAISNYWFELTTDTVTMANLVRDTILTDTTKLVSGLTNLQTYFWHVRAKNQVGWGQYSVWWRFTTLPLGPAFVNLSVIPGGFYSISTGRLNMKDTIKVYLVDSVTCTRRDSTRGVIDSVTFGASISFAQANTGNYYIFVYQRNHLAIASRLSQNIIRGSTVSYDFTTDSAKTYGFNVIKVSTAPARWGMIPADANQDGFVDGLDQTIWILQNGLDGYWAADFNGDYFVDGLDQTIWILFNGNSTFLPCGFLDPMRLQKQKERNVIFENPLLKKKEERNR